MVERETISSGVRPCALVWLILVLLLGVQPAEAQENLDAGKKPAQLFANDCSGCHKSPVGLSKAPGLFGLESFLREHYTASRQTAAAIASYLRAIDAEQPPSRAATKRRKSEPAAKPASRPSKPDDAKPSEAKPSEAKPSDVKPMAPAGDSKADAKSAGDKPPEPKVESKPAESKPAEPPAAKPE